MKCPTLVLRGGLVRLLGKHGLHILILLGLLLVLLGHRLVSHRGHVLLLGGCNGGHGQHAPLPPGGLVVSNFSQLLGQEAAPEGGDEGNIAAGLAQVKEAAGGAPPHGIIHIQPLGQGGTVTIAGVGGGWR